MERHRISNVMAILLIGTAALIDGAQFIVSFIPVIDIVLDWFLAVIAGGIFGMWFALLGVNYFGGRNALAKIGTVVAAVGIELVPVLDALPAITAGVVTLILLTWSEDRAANEQLPQKAAVSAASRRQDQIDRQRALTLQRQQEAVNQNQLAANDNEAGEGQFEEAA
jgi:hypothetical protein